MRQAAWCIEHRKHLTAVTVLLSRDISGLTQNNVDLIEYNTHQQSRHIINRLRAALMIMVEYTDGMHIKSLRGSLFLCRQTIDIPIYHASGSI